MKEKDLKEQLNKDIHQMAPDILSNILSTPMEPVKSEEELFGNEPLPKKKINPWFVIAPTVATLAACLIIALVIFGPGLKPTMPTQNNVAFQITIDVNPSLKISVNKDGTVKKVTAINKDGKKIAKKVNARIDDEESVSYKKAVRLVMKQLKKTGYIKKKKTAMLVSVISNDKDVRKEKIAEIKDTVKKYKKNKNITCPTIYQQCKITKANKKVSKNNNVSLGKAEFCMKLADKKKGKIKKLCKKSIYDLIKSAEKAGTISEDDSLEIDEDTGINSNDLSQQETTGEDVFFIEEETTAVLEEETTAEEIITNSGLEESKPIAEETGKAGELEQPTNKEANQ